MAAVNGHRIDEVVLANEIARRSLDEMRTGLDRIWNAMRTSIDRGLHRRKPSSGQSSEGILRRQLSAWNLEFRFEFS